MMKRVLQIGLAILIGAIFYWAFLYKTPEEKHFAATLSLAQKGDVSAQIEVGDLYAQGKGTSQQGEQALSWYRKAALEGNATALWKCADLYIRGQEIAQDLEEAVPFLQLAAKQGNIPAQHELARFYEQGLGGLPKHSAESLYWTFLAAQNGDASAREEIARIKQQDPTLVDNVRRFIEDLEVAQEGEKESQLRVGEAYKQGAPVLANAEEAVYWLDRAWKENHFPQAGYALALLYQTGMEGFPADEDRAYKLLGELAQIPYAPAQYTLGELSYTAQPPKYEDAFAWFSNAASNSYAPGQYMTGFMLMQGQGTTRSAPLAITYFRSAAEQGYVDAQYVLGQIYWKGLGVPADKKVGRRWLQRAADNGNVSAQELLTNK